MNTKNIILVIIIILIVSSLLYYFLKNKYFENLKIIDVELFTNKKDNEINYYLDKSIILKLMNQN